MENNEGELSSIPFFLPIREALNIMAQLQKTLLQGETIPTYQIT
jgi:hypothetical protein